MALREVLRLVRRVGLFRSLLVEVLQVTDVGVIHEHRCIRRGIDRVGNGLVRIRLSNLPHHIEREILVRFICECSVPGQQKA